MRDCVKLSTLRRKGWEMERRGEKVRARARLLSVGEQGKLYFNWRPGQANTN